MTSVSSTVSPASKCSPSRASRSSSMRALSVQKRVVYSSATRSASEKRGNDGSVDRGESLVGDAGLDAIGVRQPRHTVHSLIVATRMRTSSWSRQSSELFHTAASKPPTAFAKSGRSERARDDLELVAVGKRDACHPGSVNAAPEPGTPATNLTTVSGRRAQPGKAVPMDAPYAQPTSMEEWMTFQPYAMWARGRGHDPGHPVRQLRRRPRRPASTSRATRTRETVLRDWETFSSSINGERHRPVHGRPHPRHERQGAPPVPQPRGPRVPRVGARALGRRARAAGDRRACSTRSRRSGAPISSPRSRRSTRCR